jgi:hypothetical protein
VREATPATSSPKRPPMKQATAQQPVKGRALEG